MADITGEEGQTLEVSYQIDNTADSESTQDVVMLRGTTEVDRDSSVTVAAGGSTTGTLSWATSDGDAGTYTVYVESDDDTESIEVQVTSASASIIDSFEDQDFTEYTDNGDGTGLTTGTTFVTDGSYGAEISRDSAGESIISQSGDGLNYYPKPGDTWQFDFEFSASDGAIFHGFLLQDYSVFNSGQQGFRVYVSSGAESIAIQKDGNSTDIDSAAFTPSTNTQHTGEVSINSSDGTITFRILDSSGAELASASGADSAAASGGAYDANYGVSWASNTTGTVYLDNITTTN